MYYQIEVSEAEKDALIVALVQLVAEGKDGEQKELAKGLLAALEAAGDGKSSK